MFIFLLIMAANINHKARKESLKPIRKRNWSSYLALLMVFVIFQKNFYFLLFFNKF